MEYSYIETHSLLMDWFSSPQLASARSAYEFIQKPVQLQMIQID